MQESSFQAGYNKGITDAVVAVYQQTNNCKATTINIGNITRQVIDISCLTKAPQMQKKQVLYTRQSY